MNAHHVCQVSLRAASFSASLSHVPPCLRVNISDPRELPCVGVATLLVSVSRSTMATDKYSKLFPNGRPTDRAGSGIQRSGTRVMVTVPEKIQFQTGPRDAQCGQSTQHRGHGRGGLRAVTPCAYLPDFNVCGERCWLIAPFRGDVLPFLRQGRSHATLASQCPTGSCVCCWCDVSSSL